MSNGTLTTPWDYPRLYKRLRLALAFRMWPWKVPTEVVRFVGMRRPPEHVFEFFRRLHGIEGDE